jgi:hypothetical protein
VNGVVAWLFFGAPFCVVSMVLTVPAVLDLSSLLCLLTGDGDPDGDPEGNNLRDIKVRARGGGLWRISDAHCAYDPLHFVLFHPHGEPGWHPNITSVTPAVVNGLSSKDEQQQPS